MHLLAELATCHMHVVHVAHASCTVCRYQTGVFYWWFMPCAAATCPLLYASGAQHARAFACL